MIFKIYLNRFLFLFFIFYFYSLNLFANNIAVFDMNKVYENNKNFQDFVKITLENKNKEMNSLDSVRNDINKLKNVIENDSLILDQESLNLSIENYNKKIEKFNYDLNLIENKYQTIIKKNEQILLQFIINIVSDLAKINEFDVILTEKSYFLVSENIDITNVIVQKLNEKNIIFKADIN